MKWRIVTELPESYLVLASGDVRWEHIRKRLLGEMANGYSAFGHFLAVVPDLLTLCYLPAFLLSYCFFHYLASSSAVISSNRGLFCSMFSLCGFKFCL